LKRRYFVYDRIAVRKAHLRLRYPRLPLPLLASVSAFHQENVERQGQGSGYEPPQPNGGQRNPVAEYKEVLGLEKPWDEFREDPWNYCQKRSGKDYER
jgi:hypothetical protein